MSVGWVAVDISDTSSIHTLIREEFEETILIESEHIIYTNLKNSF